MEEQTEKKRRGVLGDPKKNTIVFLFLSAIFFGWYICSYTVDETEMAAVFRFGKPLYDIKDPGLHFKLPWPLNSVNFVEKRYFIYDSATHEIMTSDKKTLVIDDFSPCRITDPISFLQRTQTIRGAMERIDDTIYSILREKIGTKKQEEIVVTERDKIMADVTNIGNEALRDYALEVGTTRITRVELPDENKRSVYDRMEKERLKDANKFRSEGDQERNKIQSDTDRQVDVILSEANRQAQEIRGQADAEATQIYNKAYSLDPEFFNIYRSIQTAKEVLGAESGSSKKFILDENNPFLKYLLKK